MRLLFLFLFLSTFVFGQEILISENFEEGIPADWSVETNNPKRNWIHKTFREMNYMHMSAFGGQGKTGFDVKATLHTPLLDISDKNCKLKFAFADAFKNGQPLHVYLSNENKNPLGTLSQDNWKDLVNNNGSYDNNYESTPWIQLPKIQQPYHISFVYNSNQKDKKVLATTLIQLGEVDVWCE